MNIIQFNEIIELLHSISDNSTANIIALVSVIISGIAVLSSIYFSVQTRKQYIDSLSPLLSFRLYEKSGYLFLRIENTGQSEATEISLTFKELSNNGEQNKFELDEILKSKLTLYPNETVTGGICRSGRNIVTSIAPVIKIEVSYIKGNTKEKIQFFANHYLATEHIFFMGRGIDYAISMEGSLKLKEISYIHSEAYAAGELKHGTISLMEEGTLVVALATQDALYPKTVSNMIEVKTRGAFVMALSTKKHPDIEKYADYILYIPETQNLFAGSLAIIPLQLFAYYVSLGRGLDVDKPRNLAKSVTVE